MRSSDEVRDYVYAQQEEIHRKRARLAQQERDLIAQSDREIDQAAQATRAMDESEDDELARLRYIGHYTRPEVTEDMHDAVGDVGEELLLPPLRTPMVTYDPADLADIHWSWRCECGHIIESDGDDEVEHAIAHHVSWCSAHNIPAADSRGLIRALANPWLWLITLALWGVLIGAGWLLWQVVT
jgi:hypothetical protein